MKFITPVQINELAEKIRSSLAIESEYFIDITKVANDLDCQVYEVKFANSDIAGTLTVNNENVIRVNQDDPEPRKRFTIAHEIAHYILHHRDDKKEYVDYRQPVEYYEDPEDLKKEIQANMLAAALLMPRELVENAWRTNPDIDDLAETFHVSKRAATIRLDALGLLW